MNEQRTADESCIECGMVCKAMEYHPYAFCLMFKGCHDAKIVRANADVLIARGYQQAIDEGVVTVVRPDETPAVLGSNGRPLFKGSVTADCGCCHEYDGAGVILETLCEQHTENGTEVQK